MNNLTKNEEFLLRLFRRVPEDDQAVLLAAIKEYLSNEEKRDGLLVELFDKYCEEDKQNTYTIEDIEIMINE